MDWPGFVTFTVFIASLLLALTFAAYGTEDIRFVGGLAALAAVAMMLFVRTERRKEHPLLDLGLLQIREFTGGVITQLMNSLAWGGFLLVISLYMQLVLGYSTLQAGVAIIPFDLAFLAVGPISGRLSDMYGTRPFTTAGLVVISLSLLLTGTTGVSTPYPILALYLVIGGVGIGLFASPNMSSIMGSVPIQRRSVASAVRATFFNVGYTISLNVAILVMTFNLPFSQITAIISSLTPTALPLAERTGFALAINHVYLVMAVVNTIAIVPSLLRGNRKAAETETPVKGPTAPDQEGD
jgi:MFS family permease